MICAIFSWMEYWYRKQRQYVCRAQTWSEDVFNAPIQSNTFESTVSNRGSCDADEHRLENELREVTCSNKNDGQLMEVQTNLAKLDNSQKKKKIMNNRLNRVLFTLFIFPQSI